MPSSRRERWTPIAGFAAAVTFAVGVVMVGSSPNTSDSDAHVVTWYARSSHRAIIIVGAYLLMFFGLFLLWFAAGLRERLKAAAPSEVRIANIAFGGALLSIALIWAGAFALAAVPAGRTFGSEPALATADVARFLPQVGFGAILVGGMFGALAMIEAVSIIGMRSGALPRWLVWLGFVCGIVLLFGAFFIPAIALPIWLAATGVVMWRSAGESSTA